MALTDSTIQTLDFLNQLVEREYQSKEKDEQRALDMLQMKVASDERELDRLNQRLMAEQENVFELEKKAAELIRVRNKTSTPDKEGFQGEASAIASQELGRTVSDRRSAINALDNLTSRRDQLLGDISSFYQAGREIAPRLFDKYAKGGKGISEMSQFDEAERVRMMKDEALEGLTEFQIAGIMAALPGEEATEFDRLYKQRQLDLEEKRLGLMSLKARLEAKGADQEEKTKAWAQEWNQYRQGMEATAERLGFEFQALPSTLSNPASFRGAMDVMTTNIARLADKAADEYAGIIPAFGSASDELVESLDRWRDAKSDPARQNAAYEIAFELSKVGGLENLEGSDEIEYMNELIHGLDILQQGQTSLGIPDKDLVYAFGERRPLPTRPGAQSYGASGAWGEGPLTMLAQATIDTMFGEAPDAQAKARQDIKKGAKAAYGMAKGVGQSYLEGMAHDENFKKSIRRELKAFPKELQKAGEAAFLLHISRNVLLDDAVKTVLGQDKLSKSAKRLLKKLESFKGSGGAGASGKL